MNFALNEPAPGGPFRDFTVSDEHAVNIMSAIMESFDALCTLTEDVKMKWQYPQLSNSPTAHWAANNLHNTIVDDVGLLEQLGYSIDGLTELRDVVKDAARRYQLTELAHAEYVIDLEA